MDNNTSKRLTTMTNARSLFDKIWERHVVTELDGGISLLHIDRHFIHDLVANDAMRELSRRGRFVRNPELTTATVDHAVASSPGRSQNAGVMGAPILTEMRRATSAAGIKLYDVGMSGQGIVHVMAPELGLSLPGQVIVCGDSHTCTHGGLGAIAFGIGSSEVVHVLATQTLRQKRPRTMRISYGGRLASGVTAKDLILYTIGKLGTGAGRGFAVEYAGSAITSLGIEPRLTVCNLSIELGAKIGLIAPDDVTFAYAATRPHAPKGALFDRAVSDWQTLPSDEHAAFAVEHRIDAAGITPQVTWGTSPEDVVAIEGHIPFPEREADSGRRDRMQAAIDYMGLEPGTPIAGTPLDWVFIGSCANSRLSDLQEAAEVVSGRRVAKGVRAWVVPGSESVKRAAELQGLDRIFLESGFEWREPSCSLCVSANGDKLAPGQRSLSTSNRNFVGRQGVGARTHLASPAMAAASAITGVICDVREFSRRNG
jgi:3-isopropylmalate/(R)-2-methylmalate dehydratase large subunit